MFINSDVFFRGRKKTCVLSESCEIPLSYKKCYRESCLELAQSDPPPGCTPLTLITWLSTLYRIGGWQDNPT